MSCNPETIACQLGRLVEATGGWDWNAFLSTVVATLIGGVLGLVGVWLGFRWQSKHRYREVLDDSIVKVLEQIAVQATALRQYQRQREFVEDYDRAGTNFFERTGESALDEPADFTLSMTMDIAQMRARDEDQSIVSAAIRVHDEIRAVGDLDDRLRMLGLLGGALSRWRSGIWSVEEVLQSLSRVRAFSEPLDVELDVE